MSLQLRDAQNTIIAQLDSRPRGDSYPTALWEPGEVVGETRTLFLPPGLAPGEYGLYACLYDPTTLQRLPVTGPQGASMPLNEVQLGTVAVGDGNAWQLTELVGGAGAGAAAGDSDRVVAGLAAVAREEVAGDAQGALATLRSQVFAHDPFSLPGLYAKLQAEDALLGDADPRLPARALDRLVHPNRRSLDVPADRRLALHLGQAMADLTQAGLWSHELLLRAVAYQVWQGAGSDSTGALLDVLLERFPQDADLRFYATEWHQRRGEAEAAVAGYEAALALDPVYAPCTLRLGALAEAAGRPEEALDWYTRYHDLAPGDLLGLQRLAAVSASLGRPEAAALQQELAQFTDDSFVAAQLLGLPVGSVQVGADLATNGGYEGWWGDEPAWWRWWWSTRVTVGGPEPLLAPEGHTTARIDELSRRSPRGSTSAGFWYRKKSKDVPPPLTLAPGDTYLVSLWYRTAPGADPNARLYLTGAQDVLWRGDHRLPATEGEWHRFVAAGRNTSGQPAQIQPLIRAYAPGSVQFDRFEVRPIRLAPGAPLPAETLFAVLTAAPAGG